MSGFPVRCFTCGKVIGNLENKINEMKENNVKIEYKSLEKLGIRRYCCSRMIMGYVDIEVYPREDVYKK